MSLRDLARLAELGMEAYRAQSGDAKAREKLLRGGLPLVCDVAFGKGGGTLASVGLELLERRGLLAGQNVVDGEYTVLDESREGACVACSGHYSRRAEQQVSSHLKGLTSGVVVILGRPGTGKTVLSCVLAEHWDRQTYVIGIPEALLPGDRWRELDLKADSLESVPDGSALLIDDTLNFFHARANRAPSLLREASALNRQLEDLMAIARHRRLLVVANMQTTRGLEPGLLIHCEALALKPPSLVWQLLEQPDSRKLWAPALEAFEGMSQQDLVRHVYVLTHQAAAVCHVTAPAWWSDQVSRNKAN